MTKIEFIRAMKAKYVTAEDLWWMTEEPEEVVRDITEILRQFEHTYHQLADILGIDD